MVTDYFKITAREHLTIEYQSYQDYQISYRIDGGNWQQLQTGYQELFSGQTVEYKGSNFRIGGDYMGFAFSSDGEVNISGNLYSLLDDINFSGITSLLDFDVETFRKLFYTEFGNYLMVVDASELELPATTLTEGCYQQMFFQNSHLTAAPKLPATTLAEGCYDEMFRGCVSLTTAPDLPATNVPYHAYSWTFADCENLNSVVCLATQLDNAREGIAGWLVDVATGGTLYQNSAHTIDWANLTPGGDGYGDKSIPNTWSVVDYVPPVPRPTIEAAYVGTNEVSKIYMGSDVIYEKSGPAPIDYSTMPLTFEALSDGTIKWAISGTSSAHYNNEARTIQYSKDGGETWTSITSNRPASAPTISVTAGDIIQFRGNNERYGSETYGTGVFNLFSGGTFTFNVYGNIMSLMYGDNFTGQTTFSRPNTFNGLFCGCTGLRDVSNLVLPATTLTSGCYYHLFQGCTGLTSVPSELPATNLSGVTSCYRSMFRNCYSLTTVPSDYLPATTLEANCYDYMFIGCRNLTTAPDLPATTLSQSCYFAMFSGCTSLTTAPDLPATTLAQGCYNSMFGSCYSLNYIKCLATDISATNCTYNWVEGVASSGTFECPSSTNWSSKTGSNGIPSGWTRVNA